MGAYVCTVLGQVYHLHSVKSDDNGTEAASLKKKLSKRGDWGGCPISHK